MNIKQKVNVYRVGYGEIQDERTGLVTEWAKVYSMGDESVVNNGIVGLPENHYSVMDKDGNPDIQLAKRIAADFHAMNPTEPKSIEFDFAFKSQGKKQVLAIVGMPVTGGVKNTATKAAS